MKITFKGKPLEEYGVTIPQFNPMKGYESPIRIVEQEIQHEIMQARDRAVLTELSVKVGVDVDKDELEKAMKYDRAQYMEGYNNGFEFAIKSAQELLKLAENSSQRAALYMVLSMLEEIKGEKDE